jgi:hypothetical protein
MAYFFPYLDLFCAVLRLVNIEVMIVDKAFTKMLLENGTNTFVTVHESRQQ